jgi:hypothetical protein
MSQKRTEKNSTNKVLCSINVLRDKDFNGVNLSINERLSLKNYERFRISELNKQTSEDKFLNKYYQLQVMANLCPYEEFLKEIYFN